MNRTIVPTDFSSSSDCAIEYTAALTADFGGELILYHCFNSEEKGSPNSVKTKKNLKLTETKLINKLDEIRNKLLTVYPELRVSLKVDCGEVSKCLRKYALKSNSNLVIVGLDKEPENSTFGSTDFFNYIIEKSSCPILTIPEGFAYSKSQNITYVSTYDKKDVKLIGFLSKWSTKFRSVVNILHIATEKSSVVDETILNYKTKIEKQFKFKVALLQLNEGNTNDNIEQITNVFNENQTNIVAITPLRLGSMVNDLLYDNINTDNETFKISIPFLLVPLK